MITNENSTMPYMKSLSSCLNKMTQDGYSADFKATEEGLYDLGTHKIYYPSDVRIVNFFRFEGPSNPEDNAILYVIEAGDGVKGTLVDAYGVYSDPYVDRFIRNVDDIHKKVSTEEKGLTH
ncbi:MAG: hypothetical protein H7122_15765 [Chitinophagaceae bacterium]|nr:hypothetical protein [Chitinophagaceae bacterium]